MGKCRKVVCLLAFVLCMLQAGTKVCATERQELLRHLEEASQGAPVYEVVPDGTGDFSSIQEAVEQVESGATLLIYQGIYEENVQIIDKTVNLIGADRDTCILIANTESYHHVPLTVGAGVVYNMTICGSNPTMQNMAPSAADMDFDAYDPISIYNVQSRFPGYAVHVDQDYSSDKELMFENCRIISDSSYCVGIGCRGGNSVTFVDCQLYSSGGGCLYIHNSQNELENRGDAYFLMRDCELKNYVNPYVMSVRSTGDWNPLYLTFQNVKVSTVAYASKYYKSDNMNTWYSVDQLSDLAVQRQLETEGFYTPLGRRLVHYCGEGEHAYQSVGRSREALLGRWPDFPEGIHYIGNTVVADHRQTSGRQQVIEILNKDEEAEKNGWCGLHNIYLTEDSYGNTLTEMNYCRKAMDVGAE